MTTLRKAAQQALEALEWHLERGAYGADIEGVTGNLRDALAQQAEPVQEPVAWYQKRGQEVLTSHPACWGREDEPWTPLYTALPQRQPQTLDDALTPPRAMAQAYEAGYKAGAAAERKRIIQFLTEMQRQVGDGHNYYGVAAMRIREMV